MWECPRHRFRMRCALNKHANDELQVKALEEMVFAHFPTIDAYREKMRSVLYNMYISPTLRMTRPLVEVLLFSNEDMATGTMMEVVSKNEQRREEMLTHLMKEKIADIDEMGVEGPLRCKTCGSSAVVWDQKQTRSADEVIVATFPPPVVLFVVLTPTRPAPTAYTTRLLLHILHNRRPRQSFAIAPSATRDGG